MGLAIGSGYDIFILLDFDAWSLWGAFFMSNCYEISLFFFFSFSVLMLARLIFCLYETCMYCLILTRENLETYPKKKKKNVYNACLYAFARVHAFKSNKSIYIISSIP